MWTYTSIGVVALSFASSFCRLVSCDESHGSKNMIRQQGRRELIIHGETAEKGRYPYFVTLDRDCGGALIAPDIVLTAGHCKPSKSQYKTLRPRVGTYSFTKDKRGVDYEEFRIITSIRHPDFVRVGDDEFIYDFSIIQLDRPVSKDIIPVRINRNNDIPATRGPRHSTNIVAMGMGYTHAGHDSLSDILKQVTLNPVSNKLCARSTDGYESYRGRIHSSHMCTTGGPRNKRDACAYDSGSPIIIPADRRAIGRHEGDLLVGLVSWGHGCADPDFPGVNARVSAVSDWIDHTVRTLSSHPPAEFFLSEIKIPSLPASSSRLEEAEEVEVAESPPLIASRVVPRPPPQDDFWTTSIHVTVSGLLMLLAVGLFRDRRRRQACSDTMTLLELNQKELTSRLLTPRTAASSSDAGSYGSMESMVSSTTSNGDVISLQ